MRYFIVLFVILLISPDDVLAKQIIYDKAGKNVTQLHDEILASFPDWKGTQKSDGTFENPLCRVEATSDKIILNVPDNVDEVKLNAVISAHIPVAEPHAEPPPRKSARTKLKGLGFTDAEISFILR